MTPEVTKTNKSKVQVTTEARPRTSTARRTRANKRTNGQVVKEETNNTDMERRGRVMVGNVDLIKVVAESGLQAPYQRKCLSRCWKSRNILSPPTLTRAMTRSSEAERESDNKWRRSTRQRYITNSEKSKVERQGHVLGRTDR
jgi:hypothetical protein